MQQDNGASVTTIVMEKLDGHAVMGVVIEIEEDILILGNRRHM